MVPIVYFVRGRKSRLCYIFDDAVSWYEETASTGKSYLGMLQDGVNGVDGLDGAFGVTSFNRTDFTPMSRVCDRCGELVYHRSLDLWRDVAGRSEWSGRLVYCHQFDLSWTERRLCTGRYDDAVSWYDRNASTGALTYGGMLQDRYGVDGYYVPLRDLVRRRKSRLCHWNVDDAVSWYEMPCAGALTYGGSLQDGVDGVDGLDGAHSVTLSADGKHAYVAGFFDDAVSWFERNASTGRLDLPHRKSIDLYGGGRGLGSGDHGGRKLPGRRRGGWNQLCRDQPGDSME